MKLFKFKCPTCGTEVFRIEKYVTIHANPESGKVTHRHVKSRYYCSHCGRETFPTEVLSVAGMGKHE